MLALSCKVSPLYDVPCIAEVNFQREREESRRSKRLNLNGMGTNMLVGSS
jgi:hypothetical protein